MSNTEVIERLRQGLDIAASPDWDDEPLVDFFNEAYLSWLQARAASAEGDERARQELLPLTRRHEAGSVDTLAMTTLKVYRILGVWGKWPFKDSKGTITVRERPLEFLGSDRYAMALGNPDAEPTDQFPAYRMLSTTAGAAQLEVLSRTTPQTLTLSYLKEPVLLSVNASPILEISDAVILQILPGAIARAAAAAESQFRYQTAAAQTAAATV